MRNMINSYLMGLLNITILVLVFGFALPPLLSAADTLQNICGVVLLVLVPIALILINYSYISSRVKKEPEPEYKPEAKQKRRRS